MLFLAKKSLVHNVLWHVTAGRGPQSSLFILKPNQSLVYEEKREKKKKTQKTKKKHKNKKKRHIRPKKKHQTKTERHIELLVSSSCDDIKSSKIGKYILRTFICMQCKHLSMYFEKWKRMSLLKELDWIPSLCVFYSHKLPLKNIHPFMYC